MKPAPALIPTRWVAPACYEVAPLAPELALASFAGVEFSRFRRAYGVRVARTRRAQLEQLLSRLVRAPEERGVADRTHAGASGFGRNPLG
jgi:hypothetical protein